MSLTFFQDDPESPKDWKEHRQERIIGWLSLILFYGIILAIIFIAKANS